MNTKYFFLFLFFIVTNSFSQVSLEGIVKDSIGNPLELANVIAIDKSTNLLESYSITDQTGTYKLNLKQNTFYNLQVSYIGKKNLEFQIKTSESDETKNFTLISDNVLDEVQITYEIPITVKGDTIVYNADSFKNGSERNLEDVIEKLPGVEINEDGQVEVEGKVVNKLMVNGKDFFDGDTKIATKNIPSNAVDKIQVLRNYSEVSQLNSVRDNSDSFALNIKLKEGKENFWFGNVKTGGGYSAKEEGLYLIQPKLFYYSPKATFNFLGDFNNTGDLVLNRRDIRNFSGGFKPPSRSSGTNLDLGNNSLNFLTNQANALAIKNIFGATNFSYSPNNTIDISGFAIYNSSRINSKETTFRQYTDSDLGIPNELKEDLTDERSTQGLLKLSALYKPNFNNQVDYDIIGKISNDKQTQNVLSSVIGFTNQIEETTPFSINQNLNYYFTLDESSIFALEIQHLWSDEDPFYNAVLEDKENYEATAVSLGLDTNQISYNLAQDRRIKSNQLDAKLDYYFIINPKSNLNLTFGSILSNQKFNSTLFQFLDNDSTFDPNPTFNDGLISNDVEYKFNDIYLAARYRVKVGKFTMTPGFSLHSYGNKNIQLGNEYADNFFRIMPDFETRVQFKNSESLTFRYDMSNQFTDVTKLAKGLVLNNYDSIRFGNSELQNALSHNLSLIYSSFNLFNYTNVFARIAYSNNIDQIRNITFFENIITTNTFFNSNFADENLTAFGRVQRTFGKLIATINLSFNYNNLNQFVDARQSVNESFSQSYTPSLRTNFKKAPNIKLKYNYRISDNNQGPNKTIFYTNAPSIDFDAYIWQSVTFKSDYTFTHQRLKGGNSDSFQTWNASLAYRKNRDAKWEYELVATNLLDADSRISNTATNLFVSESRTYIQPRFISFRFRYEI